MKIDSNIPITALPPISSGDKHISDRSAIAISLDAVGRTAALPAGQDQTRAEDTLRRNLARLNDAAQLVDSSVTFSIDPDTNKIVVKVINQQNSEIMLQFPTDEALRLSSSLQHLSGNLIDHKV